MGQERSRGGSERTRSRQGWLAACGSSYTPNQPFCGVRIDHSVVRAQDGRRSFRSISRAEPMAAVATADRSPRPIRLAAAIGRRPRLLEAGLDVAAVIFIVLAFATSALSAEFLFHCVFVVLVLHAFLFGLRGTLLRIVLVSVPLVARADAQVLGMSLPALELTEWPLMFVIAGVVAWMADMRRETAQRYAALFRQASERLLTVEEDERRRVAGELHDGVGQMLTALALGLDAAAGERRADANAARGAEGPPARRPGARRDPGPLASHAPHADRGARAARGDHGPCFAVGLPHRPGRVAGGPCRVAPQSDRDGRDLPDHPGSARQRRASQRRSRGTAHGRASGARVVVEVADGGHGFDPAKVRDSGIGLAGMRERARLLGGELSIVTSPDHGTRVRLDVPLDPEQ